MKFNYTPVYIIAVATILFGCEKVIDVRIDEGTAQFAVDAFITDLPGKQTVKLTHTAPYFKNSPSAGIIGARVQVINENTREVFSFTDNNNKGIYTWSPTRNDTLARLHNSYSLIIIYNGDTIESHCRLNPVPPIDSLSYEYKEGITSKFTGYIASFWAVDIPNRKDFYWIRTFRNDTLINDPLYMNFAFDAAFEGWNADGLEFFDFVRKAITPFDKLYKLNDSVRVQLWSINEETYHFLYETQVQLTNAGLFAQPPANLPTNLTGRNKNSTTTRPVGWFVISAVKEKGITIKK